MPKLLIATVLMLKLQLKLLPKTHLKLRHNLSDKQKSLKLFSTRWKAAFFFYTPPTHLLVQWEIPGDR